MDILIDRTLCEIYDYLRLLYGRAGEPHCPICDRNIAPQTINRMVDAIMELGDRTHHNMRHNLDILLVRNAKHLTFQDKVDRPKNSTVSGKLSFKKLRGKRALPFMAISLFSGMIKIGLGTITKLLTSKSTLNTAGLAGRLEPKVCGANIRPKNSLRVEAVAKPQ